MSLIDEIQDAQIKAAEDVVCKNLDMLGLNGAGGVTRRMTPVEKMQYELIEVLKDTLKELPEYDLTGWSDPNSFLDSVLSNVRHDIGVLNNNPAMYIEASKKL